MKKIVLLLTIALSFALSASAISLKEAFNALSNVPNISVKSDCNTPILGLTVNGELAMASDLNESQILESGNVVYTILNQVPLVWMINGGTIILSLHLFMLPPKARMEFMRCLWC